MTYSNKFKTVSKGISPRVINQQLKELESTA